MTILLAIFVLLIGCAEPKKSPTLVNTPHIQEGLDWHMKLRGLTFAQAIATQHALDPDLLEAGRLVMDACKVRANRYLEQHWRLGLSERDASRYCRGYMVWTVNTWLKEQEFIIGAVTKDHDRLPPTTRMPGSLERTPKSYQDVKMEAEKMLAVLKQALEP
jgi:hypothetical protein